MMGGDAIITLLPLGMLNETCSPPFLRRVKEWNE